MAYSTIQAYNFTKHVYDRESGKVLCHTNMKWMNKNKIQKAVLNAADMLEKHHSIALRRGPPNAYKYCCIGCEKKLMEITGKKRLKKPDYTEEQKKKHKEFAERMKEVDARLERHRKEYDKRKELENENN